PVFLFESLNAAVEPGRRLGRIEHIQQGGVIGWIIVLLGLAGAVLIVLRVLFLQRSSADVERILERVAAQLRAGRVAEAIEAAKRTKGSAARVVTATLRNLDREREHLEDIISEAILNENARLNRFGTVILVIAGVAPLLGLLGTVTGMIQTFDIITEFGTSDPKLLSGGIAVALVTTELGLIVAIPTLLLGSLLAGWAERIKDEMEKVALRVVNLGLEARAKPAA
ncbi:MAG: MotA/TolQ/ExbB proton channel family protein, partial [Planctomycetota bacterium]|nr:MotA/TolQ/ExbB proton channel family protein [Planctomycetota bacterium]